MCLLNILLPQIFHIILADQDHETSTTFSCGYFSNASAADVGNFHAGFTGTIAGFSKYILWKGAGAAETYKTFSRGHIIEGIWRLNGLMGILNLFYSHRFFISSLQMADGTKITKRKAIAKNLVKKVARDGDVRDIVTLADLLGEYKKKIDVTTNNKEIITQTLSVDELRAKMNEMQDEV